MKQTANEKAAKAFVDFVLSEEGQKLASDIGYTPIREGIPAPQGLKSISELKVISSDISQLTNDRDSDKKNSLQNCSDNKKRRLSIMIDSKNVQLAREEIGEPSPLLSSFLSLTKRAAVLLAILSLLVFFIVPIAKLIGLSAQSSTGFSLEHYADILRQERLWKTLKDTFIIVAGSSSVSMLLGVLAAWVMAYTDLRHKKALHMAMMLSFILPSYVLTLSWSSFMGTQGIAAHVLQWFNPNAKPWSMYSYGGIIFVMGIHHFPLVYLLTVDVLKKIPRDLEWATRAGGAGKLKTFCLITLPLALPGLTAGGLLVFLSSLDNFGIPAFLGIPKNISVLSTLIYEEIVGFGPSAFARGAVLSVMLGMIAVIVTLLQWLAVRKIKTADTVMIDNHPRYSLGKHRTWITAAVWAFLAMITVVPLVSMVATSLKKSIRASFSSGQFDALQLQIHSV